MQTNERHAYEARLTVPFHDLDPMHVVWHGNYFKYFDIARFGLFKQSGIDLYQYSLKTQRIFPITQTSIKFISPLRHQDEFICKAVLIEASIKIVINFEIRKIKDGSVCVRAKSDQVAVKLPEMEMLFEIPHDIREALGF